MPDVLTDAHAAYEAGDFGRASELYRSAGQAQLLNQQVLKNLAVIALHEKRFGDALGLANGALPESNGSLDFLHVYGLALLKAGRFEAAADQLKRAVSISADDTRIVNTYGHSLLAAGKYEEAARCFYAAAQQNKDVFDYWQDLALALSGVSLDIIKAEFVSPLVACLRRPEIKFRNLSILGRRLIKPILASLEELIETGDYRALEEWCLDHQQSQEYSILLTHLSNVRCTDSHLEHVMANLRSLFTTNLDVVLVSPPQNLLLALASQCFLTDYVFHVDEFEKSEIDSLTAQLLTAITLGRPINQNLLALYASYYPLDTLSDNAGALAHECTTTEPNPFWETLLRLQVVEPTEEQNLRSTLPSLTRIENKTSVVVQQQYEESPYPRWPGLYRGKHKLPIGFRQSTPLPQKSNDAADHQVLIAGCGTGQHAFIYSIQQPQASITAVDLSRNSLAHAERVRRELGLDNLSFFHGDILCLPEQERVFDEISCAGVLHHLRDPGEGLRALGKVFSGKGTFHLEVYTESGRQSVVAGLAIREEYGLEATTEDIRRFRKLIYELPAHHVAKGLTESADFFSLFECRDLVFNVQEHRFNLITLSDLLTENGFQFGGIRVMAPVMELFRRQYSDPEAAKKPEFWHALEEAHPGVFGSMYNIVVSPRT